MNIILHIGTPKTATTLLQEWLYANIENLSKQGVYLSNTIGRGNNIKLVSFFKKDLDNYMKRKRVTSLEEKEKFYSGFEANFIKEVEEAKKNHHTMVISSENFYNTLGDCEEIEAVCTFLKKISDNIKVVCYFREQSQMSLSMYSTVLKNKGTMTLKKFQENPYKNFDYYSSGLKWRDAFNNNAIDFRIFDVNVFPDKDIRKDFLNTFTVKIDPKTLDYSVNTANKSLSYLEGRAYRSINRNIRYFKEGGGGVNPENLLVKSIIDECSKLKIGKITDKSQEEFRKKYVESNNKFRNEFFSTNVETLFPPINESGDINAKEFPIEKVGDVVHELTEKFCSVLIKKGINNQDSEILRNIANKYETKKMLTKKDTLFLMELARRNNPSSD